MYPMTESLSLRLFGPPSVSVGGEPLGRLRSRKGLYLLALLALRSGVAVERDFLIGTLWPESDAPAGQESLRKTLADLRSALGSAAERLRTPRRGTLLLDLSGDAFCDVTVFDAALRRWEKSGELAQAEQVAQLYRGPFLEGTTDDWVLRERELRASGAEAVLEVLALRALDEGDLTRALTLARRAERIEPLRESVQRLLYRALAVSGDLPAAQRAFREFRLRLHESARLSPDPETIALVQQLTQRTQPLPQSPRTLPVPSPLSEERQQSPAPHTSAGLRHFPLFLTPLQGRAEVLPQLRAALEQSALTTLVGMGGMGKTRLAVAVAAGWESASFVDLAPLPPGASPQQLREALFRAVGVGGEEAETQLRELVRHSEQLLVLDNGEPVLEGLRTLLPTLLHPEQKTRFLLTSREPLGLRGEQVVRLEPLTEEESLALFLERARAVGEELPKSEHETLRAICQRLAGLPLAIELAAARIAVLTPPQLLERLARPLRLLTAASQELPERQRSLRTVLEDSYSLLRPVAREALEALSVFVGPFALEDAEALLEPLADDPLTLVESLHQASFLVRRPTGWTFLQPVRDFAQERLATAPERAQAIRRHHACFQARLGEQALREAERGSASATRRLWERAEDRAAALAWTEQANEPELTARLCWVQATYLRDARRYHESEALLTLGLTRTSTPLLRQYLLEAQGWLRLDLGDLEATQRCVDAAAALAPPPSSLSLLTGMLHSFRGETHALRGALQTAFTTALAEDNPIGAAQSLLLYASRARRHGDPQTLETLPHDLEAAQRALEHFRTRERPPHAQPSLEPALLQAQALLYQLQDNDRRSVELLEQAIAYYESQRQGEQLADAQLLLARMLFRLEQPEAAEAATRAAAARHRHLGNDDAARQSLVTGLCQAKFTRWFGQAQRLRAALASEEGALDPTNRARMVLFEGCVLMRYGSPEEARVRLQEAAQRFRWLGDPQTETILNRLAGWTYLDAGDTERAHHEALQLQTLAVLQGTDEEGKRRVFLAECLRRRGEIERATALLAPLDAVPEAHVARGLCALEQAELERAEAAFQEACAQGEVELSVEWLGYASLGRVQVALHRGERERAQKLYLPIVTRAQRAEDRLGWLRCEALANEASLFS